MKDLISANIAFQYGALVEPLSQNDTDLDLVFKALDHALACLYTIDGVSASNDLHALFYHMQPNILHDMYGGTLCAVVYTLTECFHWRTTIAQRSITDRGDPTVAHFTIVDQVVRGVQPLFAMKVEDDALFLDHCEQFSYHAEQSKDKRTLRDRCIALLMLLLLHIAIKPSSVRTRRRGGKNHNPGNRRNPNPRHYVKLTGLLAAEAAAAAHSDAIAATMKADAAALAANTTAAAAAAKAKAAKAKATRKAGRAAGAATAASAAASAAKTGKGAKGRVGTGAAADAKAAHAAAAHADASAIEAEAEASGAGEAAKAAAKAAVAARTAEAASRKDHHLAKSTAAAASAATGADADADADADAPPPPPPPSDYPFGDYADTDVLELAENIIQCVKNYVDGRKTCQRYPMFVGVVCVVNYLLDDLGSKQPIDSLEQLLPKYCFHLITKRLRSKLTDTVLGYSELKGSASADARRMMDYLRTYGTTLEDPPPKMLPSIFRTKKKRKGARSGEAGAAGAAAGAGAGAGSGASGSGASGPGAADGETLPQMFANEFVLEFVPRRSRGGALSKTYPELVRDAVAYLR
jgi:hypothetical protein